MSAKPVAIVDPYSSGTLLATAFNERGIVCDGVQTSADVPAIYESTFQPEKFRRITQHTGDLDGTADRLREQDVGLVLPGCELGVDLAERLGEQLRLPTNRPEHRAARRSKSAMAEALVARELRVPAHFSGDRLPALLAWVRATGWPIVVKPDQSTGSDEVHLCHSEGEVKSAFERILGRRNLLGLKNETVLAQEFLRGTEYVVDTTSHAGHHRVAAFWKYGSSSPDGPRVGYEQIELLPGQGKIQTRLQRYVTDALDCLGIENGAAHCEVMHTNSDELALIEIGARLHGGVGPELCRLCVGRSQIDLLIESYLDPGTFLQKHVSPYVVERHGLLAFLVAKRPGRLKAFRHLDEIAALASVHQLHARDRPDRITPGIVGWIMMVHKDEAVLRQELRRIRELERDAEEGLYFIE